MGFFLLTFYVFNGYGKITDLTDRTDRGSMGQRPRSACRSNRFKQRVFCQCLARHQVARVKLTLPRARLSPLAPSGLGRLPEARRFMPKADHRTLTMAAIWLVGQCTVFVRDREQLANPPVSLYLDDAAVEGLTSFISALALAGLAAAELGQHREAQLSEQLPVGGFQQLRQIGDVECDAPGPRLA